MPDQTWSDWIAWAGATPNAPGYEQVRQRILDAAQPMAGEIAADVGAGLGLLTFALAQRVQPTGKVIAVEPDAMCRTNLLQTSENRPEGVVVDVRSGRVEELPLDDRSCDLVVMRSVLIYVQDRRRALQECARVLKSHGRLACWEPINAYRYRQGRLHQWFDLSGLGPIAATVAQLEQSYYPAGSPICNFTESDLLRDTEAAGFSRIKLTLDRTVEYRTLTMDRFKTMVGWNQRLAPHQPTLQEVLSEQLAPKYIEALLDLIDRQLPSQKIRIEGATALLIGYTEP